MHITSEQMEDAVYQLSADLLRITRCALGELSADQRNTLAVSFREVLEQQLEHLVVQAQHDPRGYSPGYIRVPFGGKSDTYRPLLRCVNRTSSELSSSPWLVAKTASYIFQYISDEVAFGEVIRVPGFGIFGPATWRPKYGDRPPFCQPWFYPAHGFRRMVAAICHVTKARDHELQTFRRSHHPSSRPDRATSCTSGAMQGWRDDIDRQAGYEVRGKGCH